MEVIIIETSTGKFMHTLYARKQDYRVAQLKWGQLCW